MGICHNMEKQKINFRPAQKPRPQNNQLMKERGHSSLKCQGTS